MRRRKGCLSAVAVEKDVGVALLAVQHHTWEPSASWRQQWCGAGSPALGQGCVRLWFCLIQWQSQGSLWISLGMCPLSSWRCAVRHCPVSRVLCQCHPWALIVVLLGQVGWQRTCPPGMGSPCTPATHTPQGPAGGCTHWHDWQQPHQTLVQMQKTNICFPSLTIN